MKEPKQWAIKQHIEKYPKCEWLCTHTNLPNLGEMKKEVTNQTPQPFEELKRDMVNELSNAYYEVYRYERPNDTYEQLGAFCRDLASNAVDELLSAQRVAHRAERVALIERVRTEVIGEDEGLQEQSDLDKIDVPHPETDRMPGLIWVRQASRNIHRFHQRTALDKLKTEYEGEK